MDFTKYESNKNLLKGIKLVKITLDVIWIWVVVG